MPTAAFGLSVLTSAAIAIGTAPVTSAAASRLGASHGSRVHSQHGQHGGHVGRSQHGRQGSAARACRLRALLELRGGLSFSSSSSPSPQAVVHAWRAERLDRFAASFDASRYHAQVLFFALVRVRARARARVRVRDRIRLSEPCP